MSELTRLGVRLARLGVASALVALSLGLAGCAASTSGGGTSTGTASATVTGTIVRVGGPLGPGGTQPTPVPMDGMAAVYRQVGGATSVSGKPVLTVGSSASHTGTFSFSIAPGHYLVVAVLSQGNVRSAPKAIDVTAGQSFTVRLIIPVP